MNDGRRRGDGGGRCGDGGRPSLRPKYASQPSDYVTSRAFPHDGSCEGLEICRFRCGWKRTHGGC